MCDSIGDYARSMALDCNIDSSCVFISDKTTPDTKLYYLGNYGVSQEVLDRYSRFRICDVDPFTDIQLNESRVDENEPSFQVANHPQVSRCGARAKDYWGFTSQEDIDVVGAATFRLRPRLYLSIGAHRSRRISRRKSVPIERLTHRIDILHNKIATHILSQVLRGSSGYAALLGAVGGKGEEQPHVGPALSARETEIARLVCEGRQNKEIAWIATLSEYTVENHLRRIYQKLGIHNRAALVARLKGALA